MLLQDNEVKGCCSIEKIQTLRNRFSKMKDIKVDLVYLWVDGEDPQWKKKKKSYLGASAIPHNDETTADCRFVDHDELKYSLRSVEMYAPWINNIYILTDGHYPKWLDLNHPKVKVIDHKDFIPNEYLPLFNSMAIELYIGEIEGLSEHFIYGNDDMLFAKPTPKSFFFNEEGYPKARFKKRSIGYYKLRTHRNYAYTIYRTILQIKKDFGQTFEVTPHHCFDAYTKSVYNETMSYYREWREQTMKSRFRGNDDMQRNIISLYALCQDKAELHYVERFNGISGVINKLKAIVNNSYAYDSRYLHAAQKDLEKDIEKANPYLICINDTESATREDREMVAEYFKNKYSEKSSFEI